MCNCYHSVSIELSVEKELEKSPPHKEEIRFCEVS